MKILTLSNGETTELNDGSTDLLMYCPVQTAAKAKTLISHITSCGMNEFLFDTEKFENHKIVNIKSIKSTDSYVVEIVLKSETPEETRARIYKELTDQYKKMNGGNNGTI